jgi:hypothetical protein
LLKNSRSGIESQDIPYLIMLMALQYRPLTPYLVQHSAANKQKHKKINSTLKTTMLSNIFFKNKVIININTFLINVRNEDMPLVDITTPSYVIC